MYVYMDKTVDIDFFNQIIHSFNYIKWYMKT